MHTVYNVSRDRHNRLGWPDLLASLPALSGKP